MRRYGKKAAIIAGGTDLLGKMKDEILPTYPEALVNIKSIPGLDYVARKGGILAIGSLTRLEDIATNDIIRAEYPALAEAARRTASTHLREMGTIGGNICQDIRCWYYRNPNNRFPCLRKGGGRCYAIDGDNRYHSIFGGSVEKGCYAVHPSDTAPALVVLGATVLTTKRHIKAEDFFEVAVTRTTILDADEIVTEIQLPPPVGKSAFLKFALRKAIDFPIVNCAAAISVRKSKGRLCADMPQRGLRQAVSSPQGRGGHAWQDGDGRNGRGGGNCVRLRCQAHVPQCLYGPGREGIHKENNPCVQMNIRL